MRLPETGLMESEWRCGIKVVVAGSGSPPVSLEDCQHDLVDVLTAYKAPPSEPPAVRASALLLHCTQFESAVADDKPEPGRSTSDITAGAVAVVCFTEVTTSAQSSPAVGRG